MIRKLMLTSLVALGLAGVGLLGMDAVAHAAALPSVNDRPPSVEGVTRTGVVLTGTIDPNEVDTRYKLLYGTTTAYGHDTAYIDIGAGVEDQTVGPIAVNELTPGTTYHFALVATNAEGTTTGPDNTFTTEGLSPPMVATGSVSGVTQNEATLSANVNTRGLSTSYGFEVGTSTNYGPPTGLGVVGAGAIEAPVALSLTGLQPNTTYHYRVTATNIDGASYGSDQTFTTSGFPNAFIAPPAPLPFVSVPTIAFPTEAKTTVVGKDKSKPKAKKNKKRGKVRSKSKRKKKK